MVSETRQCSLVLRATLHAITLQEIKKSEHQKKTGDQETTTDLDCLDRHEGSADLEIQLDQPYVDNMSTTKDKDELIIS
jgi:hypothetical protein